MILTLAATLLLPMLTAAALPKIHLLYPPPSGTVFDRNCSGMLKDAAPLNQAWVDEAVRRVPEFQARWDKEGPAYLTVLFDTITTSTFSATEVLLPPLAVLQAFEKRVSPLFALVRANLLESRTQAALRDTLLPKLLSGELRVPNAVRTAETVL